MGTQSEQLKQEIEQTRTDISRDVDALAYKASPSRIVGSRVDKARSGLTGLKEKVMGSHDSNGSSTSTVGAVKDHAGSAAHTVTDAVSSAPGHVSDAGHSVASGVTSAASTVGSKATDVASSARSRAEGNPLAAGVIAFGFGWLASSLIPASAAETRAVSKIGDVASDKAGPALQKAKDEFRTAASEVGESLKAPAREAAESVKATATDGVQAVKHESAGAAHDVAGTVRRDESSWNVDVTEPAAEQQVGVGAAGYGYNDTPAYTGEPGRSTNQI